LSRRDRILPFVDKAGLGMEIGPSHDPIAPKRDGYNVHVVDHMSREQLVHKYATEAVAHDRIEEVDFVWSGQSYAELTGRTGAYDWIIASHMIEHTPDLIAFLANCEAVLKERGVLCLVVPDKRYCFDRFRPVTGIARVIDAHLAKQRIHSPGAVAEYFLNVVRKGPELGWPAEHRGEYSFVHGVEDAKTGIREVIDRQSYLDVHDWCFVPSSFRLMMDDLYALGYTALREVAFHPTEGFEFYIVLGRQGSGSGHTRLALLRAIEDELAQSEPPPLPPAAPPTP
jgi:SAM-dependent methyltransferase